MARQAFKKQYLEWFAKAQQVRQDQRQSFLKRAKTDALLIYESQFNLSNKMLGVEEAPLF